MGFFFLVKEKGIEPDEVKFSAENFSKFLKEFDTIKENSKGEKVNAKRTKMA